MCLVVVEMLGEGMREFFEFLLLQSVSYSILSYNFRVLAQGRMVATLVSEAAYACFCWTIVRKMAAAPGSGLGMIGYVIGCCIGVAIGLKITRRNKGGEQGQCCCRQLREAAADHEQPGSAS